MGSLSLLVGIVELSWAPSRKGAQHPPMAWTVAGTQRIWCANPTRRGSLTPEPLGRGDRWRERESREEPWRIRLHVGQTRPDPTLCGKAYYSSKTQFSTATKHGWCCPIPFMLPHFSSSKMALMRDLFVFRSRTWGAHIPKMERLWTSGLHRHRIPRRPWKELMDYHVVWRAVLRHPSSDLCAM